MYQNLNNLQINDGGGELGTSKGESLNQPLPVQASLIRAFRLGKLRRTAYAYTVLSLATGPASRSLPSMLEEHRMDKRRLERETRLELATFALARQRSTN
jgi:hypothetical protein